MYSPRPSLPILDRLRNCEISREQALQELVVKGAVNLEQLDSRVINQFFRSVRDRENLPPVIPLLFWQHCYYLGSPIVLSEDNIWQIRRRMSDPTIEINQVPISARSYYVWKQHQQHQNLKLVPSPSPKTETGIIPKVPTVPDEPEGQIRWLRNIIISASEQRASDIHLEPCPVGLKVKFRIDGILHHIVTLSPHISRRIIIALKVMCDMDIAESRCPQDGRIAEKYAINNQHQTIDLRVSVIPVHSPKRGEAAEKAVLRILRQQQTFPKLTELGFSERTLPIYQRWLSQPQGMIIITGPTGSGKSNTLCASLQAINREDVNIATLEDPIEQVLDDINQTQVHEEAGMTFANGLRAILRQDPDIIMVGEIRDKETADIAIRAALTGHLVLTTLHTNDALRTIPRLRDIGLDNGTISDALLGVVAQRLVRRVCPHCAESYTPEDRELQALNLPKQVRGAHWQRGRGCVACRGSGYLGREAIVELLDVNDTVRQLIYDGTMAQLQSYLQSTQYTSFRVAAIEKITKGITTLEEIQRVLPYSAFCSI
ncbi:MAG: GspE/PulE family protein [Leptolyngbyaceae cyanobacterium bins.59]|nr:GspE/PulE family protein [Leptolyngbyaceae cyanobacterium bins.59]